MSAQPGAAGDSGLGKTRVEALTDGVFAIAATLLVFGISIPNVPQGAPPAVLQRSLLELWPKLLVYAISFITLGIYWVGHHIQYRCIRRTDRTLLWISLFFLMSVGLIPFSTTLMGRYREQHIAVTVYGANLLLVGGFLYAHWSYATAHRRLVETDIHPEVIRLARGRILLGLVWSWPPSGFSFLSPLLAIAVCALAPALSLLPGRIDLHLAPGHRSAHEMNRYWRR